MIIEPETDRTLKLHSPPKRDILLPQEKELDEESLVDSRNSIPDQSFRFFVNFDYYRKVKSVSSS